MAQFNEPSVLVDNEPVVRQVVWRVLQGERFRAIEAGEGWEMLHRLDPQVPPELLVLHVTSLHKHQPGPASSITAATSHGTPSLLVIVALSTRYPELTV